MDVSGQVTEEGTETAAATMMMINRSRPPPPSAFTADHAFAFLLLTQWSPLFMGTKTALVAKHCAPSLVLLPCLAVHGIE